MPAVSAVTFVSTGGRYESSVEPVEETIWPPAPPTVSAQGRLAPTPAAVVQRATVCASAALAT